MIGMTGGCATPTLQPIDQRDLTTVVSLIKRDVGYYVSTEAGRDAQSYAQIDAGRCGAGALNFGIQRVDVRLTAGRMSPVGVVPWPAAGEGERVAGPDGSLTARHTEFVAFALYPFAGPDAHLDQVRPRAGSTPIADTLMSLRDGLQQSAKDAYPCFLTSPPSRVDPTKPETDPSRFPANRVSFAFRTVRDADGQLALKLGFIDGRHQDDPSAETGNSITVIFGPDAISAPRRRNASGNYDRMDLQ